MKLRGILPAAFAATALLASCNDARRPMETVCWFWSDSTAHAYMAIDAELPSGSGKAAANVRRDLSETVVDGLLSHVTSYEEERFFPPYDGDWSDITGMLEYYRDSSFAQIARMSQEDAYEREEYIMQDTDFSEEEKAEILSEMPEWCYEFSLTKADETERYVVFQSFDYVYLGGAHGGVTGRGCLTYSKKDGSRVDGFVDPSDAGDLQPLLIAGLLDYYKECGYETDWDSLKDGLFIEDGFVPLPAWSPYPTAEGLGFIYQQYEIASYADGMPSFVVPYDDVKPFLTPEARQLLGL